MSKFFLTTSLILAGLFLTATAASAGVITKPQNNLGLIGFWNFDTGKGGLTAYDMSGSGNHGILTTMDKNTDWVDGKVGGALDFDGTDDFVVVTDTSLAEDADYTFSVWVKTEFNAGTQHFYTEGNSSNNTPFASVSNFSGVGGAGWRSDDNNLRTINGTTNIADNEWHHLVAIGSGGLLRLYVDGEAEGTPLAISGTITLNNATIGRHSRPSNCCYVDGQIDEVRVYNRALSADEIQRLYQLTGPKIAKPPLSDGLIGYWNFDVGKGGLTAYDMSSSGNHGTLTNMDKNTDWVDGKVGGALDFDGSDDLVLVPEDTTYDFAAGTSFTVSAWVKTSAGYDCGTNTDNKVAVGYRVGTPTWWFGCNQTNDTMHAFVRDSGSNSVNFSGTSLINDGVWHLLTLRVDNTNDKTAIFVDGIMENETDKNFTGNFSGTAAVCIGQYGIDCTGFTNAEWNGQIDEIRIYNRALSADEIKRLYDLTGPKISTIPISNGLVGYWNFDVGKGGLTAYDMSGNRNHGTLTAMDKRSDWVDGKIGGALDFDGTDDYVDAGSNTSIDDVFAGGGTISGWINIRSLTQTGFFSFLTKIEQPGDSDLGFDSYVTDADKALFFVKPWATVIGKWRSPLNSITLNNWLHVTIIYNSDSTSNDPLLYINGTSQTVTEVSTPSGAARPDADYPLHIGHDKPFFGTFADGQIDEVRIYNRALSADEIQRLYQLGRP
ncbi:MAG: LamG domain-containing protein [bacterium]|nr:LamG domain-containing protein [bacterium]